MFIFSIQLQDDCAQATGESVCGANELQFPISRGYRVVLTPTRCARRVASTAAVNPNIKYLHRWRTPRFLTLHVRLR
jgi:hypothetical protein